MLCRFWSLYNFVLAGKLLKASVAGSPDDKHSEMAVDAASESICRLDEQTNKLQIFSITPNGSSARQAFFHLLHSVALCRLRNEKPHRNPKELGVAN